jgi:hypothetical protein
MVAIPAPVPDKDLLEERVVWMNDYQNARGDLSFHLAYAYMKTGKMKYAHEEAKAARSCFVDCGSPSCKYPDEISSEDRKQYSNRVTRERTKKLRHTYGLIAVITCSMGSSPEILAECEEAIKYLGDYHLGPVPGQTAPSHSS